MSRASATIEAPPPELTQRIPLPPPPKILALPVIWDMSTVLEDPDYDELAFFLAFERTVGRSPVTVPKRHGRTDPALALAVLTWNGVPERQARPLLGAFLPRLATPAVEGYAFCFDEDTIASFRKAVADQSAVSTVICPEVRPVALAKLAAAELTGVLDVSIAAFGSDHIDLNALPDVVRSRMRARKDRG